MRAIRNTVAWAGLLVLAGCGHAVSSALPVGAWAEPRDKGRMRPDARLEAFNTTFRNSYGTQEGAGALVSPPTVRPAADWFYVFLARDFLAVRDTGGAIRSYWAALTLSSTTVASRADRARIRQVSYRGLSELAASRGQPRWAEMLGFSASLAAAYLASPQARREHEAFYAQVARIRAVQANAESARRAARGNRALGMFTAILGTMASAQASNAGNTAQADQYKRTADSALATSSQVSDSVSAVVRPILDALMSDSRQFRESVVQEMVNVEGGRSFLAEEVTSYLTIAEDPAPYLPLLTAFAATKPPVRAEVEPYVAARSSAALQRMAQVFRQYELWVAQNERAHL